MLKRAAAFVALLSMMSACSSSKHAAGPTTTTTAPGDPARAGGSVAKDLGSAAAASFGATPYYIELSRFRGPAPTGGLTTGTQGIAYVLSGLQSIGFRQGSGLVIRSVGAGGSVVVGPQANLFDRTSTADDLLFACLRPTTDRGSLVAVSGAKVQYASVNLTGVPPGPVKETLSVIEEQPGGRDGAHRHPGPALEFVLDGRVTFRVAGQPALTLPAGGAFVADPNQVVQPVNAGPGVARVIEVVVSAATGPARVDVDQVPQP